MDLFFEPHERDAHALHLFVAQCASFHAPHGLSLEQLSQELDEREDELGEPVLDCVGIYIHPIGPADIEAAEPTHVLTVYGADHPGIVAAVANALAEKSVNITDLQTRLAGGVYVMFMEIVLPEGADVASAVQAVGHEQGVDVALNEIERDAL